MTEIKAATDEQFYITKTMACPYIKTMSKVLVATARHKSCLKRNSITTSNNGCCSWKIKHSQHAVRITTKNNDGQAFV